MVGRNPFSKFSRGIRPNSRIVVYQSNVYGMAQNLSENFLNSGQAVDIVNMHSLQEGAWSADSAGYRVLNTSNQAYEGGAAITGMVWFADTDLLDHLLITSNGKLSEVDIASGALTTLDSSVTYGNVDFEQFGNAIYMVDGVLAGPRKYDGSTTTSAGGWPVVNGVQQFSQPRYIEEHQSRLAFMNFDGYPNHLILSDLQDGETFTIIGSEADGAIIVEVGVGDGQEIVGAKSIHIPSTNETQLIIYKNRSTYALLGTSAQPGDILNQHILVKLNDTYGAINNNCVIQVGNDIFALNEFGVTLLSSATQGGTIQPLGINSDAITGVLTRMNREAKDQCWGIHLPHRREVWFFIPTGASSKCNEAIVFKYPSPGAQGQVQKWSRRTDSGGKFIMAHGVLINKEFYIGSYDGIVGHMFASSRYDDVGIPWVYEWPDDSFKNDKQNKRLRGSASLYFNIRSAQNITVTTTWKWGGNNDITSQVLTVDSGATGARYGTARYGTDRYGSRGEVKSDFQFMGDGIRLKQKLSGTTNDSGPELLGITMELESLGLSNNWN